MLGVNYEYENSVEIVRMQLFQKLHKVVRQEEEWDLKVLNIWKHIIKKFDIVEDHKRMIQRGLRSMHIYI